MTSISSAVRPSSVLLLVALLTVLAARSSEGQAVMEEEAEMAGDLKRALEESEEESLDKRQSRFDFSVNRNRNGRPTWNAGLSHTGSRGGKYSGSLSRSGGRTSGTLGYSRQFRNGRFGAHVNRNFGRGGGTSYGLGGSWRFRRALEDSEKSLDKRHSERDVDVDSDFASLSKRSPIGIGRYNSIYNSIRPIKDHFTHRNSIYSRMPGVMNHFRHRASIYSRTPGVMDRFRNRPSIYKSMPSIMSRFRG